MTIEERFALKINVLNPNGCWLWEGSKTKNGYGQISTSREAGPEYAHRVSWKIHFGPIPDDKIVCHDCPGPRDNKDCVNPIHLYLGTYFDNTMDAIFKEGKIVQLKAECPQGHPYTLDNIYIHKGGVSKEWIQCKICTKQRAAERKDVRSR